MNRLIAILKLLKFSAPLMVVILTNAANANSDKTSGQSTSQLSRFINFVSDLNRACREGTAKCPDIPNYNGECGELCSQAYKKQPNPTMAGAFNVLFPPDQFKWCGPGRSAGTKSPESLLDEGLLTTPSTNDLDACCQVHDLEIRECARTCDIEERKACRKTADNKLASCAMSIDEQNAGLKFKATLVVQNFKGEKTPNSTNPGCFFPSESAHILPIQKANPSSPNDMRSRPTSTTQSADK